MPRTLTLNESAEFFYDPVAADRPIRFIERLCIHFEGKFRGQPFTLLDWQKDHVIRPLFGWKRRDTGVRRFQELFLLTAKGAGKTPMLTAIALYMLLADGEASPLVLSMASSFEQARETIFDTAKRYIDQSDALRQHCDPKQFQIRLKHKPGKWCLISGKNVGRSGSRPSCVQAEEAQEWAETTAQSYKLISANLFKRQQPLLLVATNAPESTNSFAYQLYDRAVKVIDGKSADTSLLPVIYEADADADWTSETAARQANPSIPEIITFAQLEPQLVKAKENPEEEQKYRRLYLSQQVQGAKKWLDLALFDRCVAPIDPSKTKGAPLYVGIDLSKGIGDLSAVIFCYAADGKFFIEPRFWLPKATAAKHESRTGSPYSQWEEAGFITLLDELTIGPAAKCAIAAEIIARNKVNPIKAVCYDRALADDAVAALEAAGIACVPVGQGWGVSRGCEELDRRLVEQSLVFAPDPIMREHAEVVEVQTDARGNYWPTKSGRKGRFAGKRSDHIDGISALVTVLTEARKHSFPAARNYWKGGVCVV